MKEQEEYLAKNLNRIRETMSAVKIKLMTGKETHWLSGDLLGTEIVFDSENSTACTDGHKIYISPIFWLEGVKGQFTMTPGMRVYLLFHEYWHKFMGHCNINRVTHYDRELWNWAADSQIAAVASISRIGDQIPGGITADNRGTVELVINNKKLVIDEAHKKSVEEIYFIILKHIKQNPGNGKGRPVRDGHSEGDSEEEGQPGNGNGKGKGKGKGGKSGNTISQHGQDVSTIDDIKAREFTPSEEGKTKQKIRDAYITAKARGNMPGWAEQILEAALSEKVDYRSELRDYITPEIKSYTTFSRTSRRTYAMAIPGVTFPGCKREGLTVGIYVDTSGSIGEKEARSFLGEIQSLFKQYDPGMVHATIHMHDTHVYANYEVNNMLDLTEVNIRGGGGTSHRDVFKKIEEEEEKVIIFLTDGYSDFPSEAPQVKMLWVVTDEQGATMIPDNLGKRIVIDVNEL
jgi:predicted metal-dependent peptidase